MDGFDASMPHGSDEIDAMIAVYLGRANAQMPPARASWDNAALAAPQVEPTPWAIGSNDQYVAQGEMTIDPRLLTLGQGQQQPAFDGEGEIVPSHLANAQPQQSTPSPVAESYDDYLGWCQWAPSHNSPAYPQGQRPLPSFEGNAFTASAAATSSSAPVAGPAAIDMARADSGFFTGPWSSSPKDNTAEVLALGLPTRASPHQSSVAVASVSAASVPAATTTTTRTAAPVAKRGRGRPPVAAEDKVKPTWFYCRFCHLFEPGKAYKNTEALLHHMQEVHQLFPAQRQGQLIQCQGCTKRFLRTCDLNKHCRGMKICSDPWAPKPGMMHPQPRALEDIGDTFGPKYGPMRLSLIKGREHEEGRTTWVKGCLWQEPIVINDA